MPDKPNPKKSKVTVRTESGSFGFSSGPSGQKSYSIADAINMNLGNRGTEDDSFNFTKSSQERAKELFPKASINRRK